MLVRKKDVNCNGLISTNWAFKNLLSNWSCCWDANPVPTVLLADDLAIKNGRQEAMLLGLIM